MRTSLARFVPINMVAFDRLGKGRGTKTSWGVDGEALRRVRGLEGRGSDGIEASCGAAVEPIDKGEVALYEISFVLSGVAMTSVICSAAVAAQRFGVA